MKEIPLTNGGVALVDDEDFEFLSKFSWSRGTGGYVMMHVGMHRLLCPDNEITDHKDQNPLNNQKENLRPATRSQNGANRRRQKSKYGLKGVTDGLSREAPSNQWFFFGTIRVDGKNKYLGTFDCPIEAARAYDAAAKKHFGEFAVLNFPSK